MLSSEKRMGLDHGPDDGKDGEDSGEGLAPAASLVALPRGGARQRLLASMTGSLAAAKEPSAAPPAEPAEAAVDEGGSVLFSKGDASASGFRPWYWSYERDGGPPVSDSAVSVTPFPVSAPSPVSPPDPVSAPATSETSPEATPRRGRRVALLAGASAAAMIAGAGFFLLPHAPPPAPPPQVALAAPSPSPAPAPAKPAVELEPAPPTTLEVAPREMAELMARGQQMLATGDIAAARLFFERAAEAGNAAAATAAGKTYDPLFLADTHARGIRGDPVAAARWYRQASAGGDHEADALMKRLMANYAG